MRKIDFSRLKTTEPIDNSIRSFIATSIDAANSTTAGVVKVVDSTSNSSATIAASANSVKAAFDIAMAASSGSATAYSNAVSTASADASTKAAAAYSNAITTSAMDASTKAATAYSNAVAIAATDASAKAATAYNNAIAYAASNTYVNNTFAPKAGPIFTGAAAFADVTISGNLTTSGTTTYINTTTLNVGDNIITLNADVTGTPTENAGIEVNRGTSANVALRWYEAGTQWQTTVDGTNYLGVATNNDVTTAYSNAVATASADASTKAAAAYTNAVSYAAANTYVNTQLATKANLTGATFTGNIVVGNTTSNIAINQSSIAINGSVGSNNQVLSSNGTATFWANAAGGTVTNALKLGIGLESAGVLRYSIPSPNNTNTNIFFGYVVSTNGPLAAMCGRFSGAVYVYSTSNGALMYTLPRSDSISVENNERSIVFGPNGMLLVGMSNTIIGDTKGAVYGYDINSFPTYTGNTINISSPAFTLIKPGTATVTDDQFGLSIDVSDDYIVVGSPLRNTYQGKVYVYSTTTKSLLYTIDNPNSNTASATDRFGTSVAIQGNKIIASAPSEAGNAGRVYTFDLSTFPASPATITSNDYTSYGHVWSTSSISPDAGFGRGVTVGPSNVVIHGSTRVYVYDTSETLLYSLTTPVLYSGGGSSTFGSSISISGDWLVIGGALTRFVYLYSLSDGTLKQTIANPNLNKLTDGTTDWFGQSLSLSGNTLVVGAPNELGANVGNISYVGVGAAYIYDIGNSAFNGSVEQTISLQKVVTAGTYGNNNSGGTAYYPKITVDEYGRVISANTVAYTPPSGFSYITVSRGDGTTTGLVSNSSVNSFTLKGGNNMYVSQSSEVNTIVINQGRDPLGDFAGVIQDYPVNNTSLYLPANGGPSLIWAPQTYSNVAFMSSAGDGYGSSWTFSPLYMGSGDLYSTTNINGTSLYDIPSWNDSRYPIDVSPWFNDNGPIFCYAWRLDSSSNPVATYDTTNMVTSTVAYDYVTNQYSMNNGLQTFFQREHIVLGNQAIIDNIGTSLQPGGYVYGVLRFDDPWVDLTTVFQPNTRGGVTGKFVTGYVNGVYTSYYMFKCPPSLFAGGETFTKTYVPQLGYQHQLSSFLDPGFGVIGILIDPTSYSYGSYAIDAIWFKPWG